MSSMATFRAFQFMVLVIIGCFALLLIVGLATQPDTCKGTIRCETGINDELEFQEGQDVVGKTIYLYRSGEKQQEMCVIKNVQYSGLVKDGIVNPTQLDLDTLNYPPCPI